MPPYTRFGVYRLVERCAARVPALKGRKITPHVVRHYIDGLTMSGTTGPMGFWTTIPDLLEIA